MTLRLPDGTLVDEDDVDRGTTCDASGCDAFIAEGDTYHEVEVRHFTGQNGGKTASTRATVCDECVSGVLTHAGKDNRLSFPGSDE